MLISELIEGDGSLQAGSLWNASPTICKFQAVNPVICELWSVCKLGMVSGCIYSSVHIRQSKSNEVNIIYSNIG